MKIVERDGKYVQIDYKCPQCKDEYLQFVGVKTLPPSIATPNSKPQKVAWHICPKCKTEKGLTRQYPLVVFKPMGEPLEIKMGNAGNK